MIWSGSTTISSIATSGSAKAFSQLLWSGKSSEVWFSLRENHVKVRGFPVFPATQHWPGTIMCDFPQRKSHAVRWLHQHPQEIRVRSTPITKMLSRSIEHRGGYQCAAYSFVAPVRELRTEKLPLGLAVNFR